MFHVTTHQHCFFLPGLSTVSIVTRRSSSIKQSHLNLYIHVCTISSVAYVQVNGLPTNQAFLQRLAEHPSFQAAELDTSFIQKHHASLTDTEAPAKHVVALAAVADHLVQVQQVHTMQCHNFLCKCM